MLKSKVGNHLSCSFYGVIAQFVFRSYLLVLYSDFGSSFSDLLYPYLFVFKNTFLPARPQKILSNPWHNGPLFEAHVTQRQPMAEADFKVRTEMRGRVRSPLNMTGDSIPI